MHVLGYKAQRSQFSLTLRHLEVQQDFSSVSDPHNRDAMCQNRELAGRIFSNGPFSLMSQLGNYGSAQRFYESECKKCTTEFVHAAVDRAAKPVVFFFFFYVVTCFYI